MWPNEVKVGGGTSEDCSDVVMGSLLDVRYCGVYDVIVCMM